MVNAISIGTTVTQGINGSFFARSGEVMSREKVDLFRSRASSNHHPLNRFVIDHTPESLNGKICLFETGGTVVGGMHFGPDGEPLGYEAGKHTGAIAQKFIKFGVTDFDVIPSLDNVPKGSHAWSADDMASIRNAVMEYLRDRHKKLVAQSSEGSTNETPKLDIVIAIPAGTDRANQQSLDFYVYHAQELKDLGATVVITGSMLTPEHHGYDGDRNIQDLLRLAGIYVGHGVRKGQEDLHAQLPPVAVVMHDKVGFVIQSKVKGTGPDPFHNRTNSGPMGVFSKDRSYLEMNYVPEPWPHAPTEPADSEAYIRILGNDTGSPRVRREQLQDAADNPKVDVIVAIGTGAGNWGDEKGEWMNLALSIVQRADKGEHVTPKELRILLLDSFPVLDGPAGLRHELAMSDLAKDPRVLNTEHLPLLHALHMLRISIAQAKKEHPNNALERHLYAIDLFKQMQYDICLLRRVTPDGGLTTAQYANIYPKYGEAPPEFHG